MSSPLFQGSTSRRRFMQLATGAAAVGAGAGAGILAPRLRGLGASAQDSTEITFWTPGGSGPFCEGFGEIANNYMAAHPNIKLGETQCGTGEQNYNEVLLARIAAGNPPDATVLWTNPASFAVRGALEPLDELMAASVNSQIENWPENVLASCQYQGQTYGLPATAGTYAVNYNQEWLDKEGIPSDRASFPKTWTELRALSKQLTYWNGDTLETMGALPKPSDAVEFAIISASNGGTIYDAVNNKYTIDSDQNVEMMDFFLSWLDEDFKGDWQKVLQSGNWSEVTVDGKPPKFQEGKLAMDRTGFWITGEFYAHIEPTFTNWNSAAYPMGPSGTAVTSGYWPNWLVIPKGTKHVKEAFDYLDYMCVDGIKVWFDKIPDLPTNKKVPLLIPQVAVDKRGEEFAEDITTFFRGLLDIATPMWTSPVADFGNDQINQAIEKIMYKQSSPKDALAEAQAAAQDELDRVLNSAS